MIYPIKGVKGKTGGSGEDMEGAFRKDIPGLFHGGMVIALL